MKVILLKDIPKVGRKYEIKDVAEGYAVNMLLPRGVVKVATPDAIRQVEKVRATDMANRQIQDELLLKNLDVLKQLTLTLKEKANDKGHLFAGVTKEMLASEIEKQTRLSLDPESLKLDKPLKEIGEHTVRIDILNKKAEFKVVIEKL